MGRHEGHEGDESPTKPLFGVQGRHSDDPLDQDIPDHHRRNQVLIFLAIVAGMIMLVILVGNLFTTPTVDPSSDEVEIAPTVTETIYDTETIEVPGPVETITVPGPTVTRTIIPAPTATPGPTITVPGPTVTIKIPQFVPLPAPTVTVTITVRPRRNEVVEEPVPESSASTTPSP